MVGLRSASITIAEGLIGAATLAACGSGGANSGVGSGSKDALTVVLPEEPLSLDATNATADRLPVTREIFRPLVSVNTNGSITGMVAKSFVQHGTTWDVTLKQGVKFSGGTPINANTVVTDYGGHVNALIENGIQMSPKIRSRLHRAGTGSAPHA